MRPLEYYFQSFKFILNPPNWVVPSSDISRKYWYPNILSKLHADVNEFDSHSISTIINSIPSYRDLWVDIVIKNGWNPNFPSDQGLPESVGPLFADMITSFINTAAISNGCYFGFVLKSYAKHFGISALSPRLKGELNVFEATYHPFSVFDLSISGRAVWHNMVLWLIRVISSPIAVICIGVAVYALIKWW